MGATRPASGINERAYTLNKGSALITRQSVNLCLDARRGTRLLKKCPFSKFGLHFANN